MDTDPTEILSHTPSPGVAVARLNRPARRNALDGAAVDGLLGALDAAEQRGDRVLVLTGGDRFFSAGGDVFSMPGTDDGLLGPAARLTRVHDLVLRMTRSDLLTVAAVEGYAIGAAWGLVLAADVVVAAEDAWFSAPFAARGLTADAGTAFHLPRRLGRHRAASHLLLGRRLTASEALDAGLLTEVVAAGQATPRAVDLARTLADGPSESNLLTKSLVTRQYGGDLADFLAAERTAVSLAGHGRDAREGRAAFLERREPHFS